MCLKEYKMHQWLFIIFWRAVAAGRVHRRGDQNKGYEGSMMMKQMRAMPLKRRKKVKWRLLRWIHPPFWCLVLFGQKIPADRLDGCWVTHMVNTHNLGKCRPARFILKRFLFTADFLRMAILTRVSHFLKSYEFTDKWFGVIFIFIMCHASNDI